MFYFIQFLLDLEQSSLLFGCLPESWHALHGLKCKLQGAIAFSFNALFRQWFFGLRNVSQLQPYGEASMIGI